LKEKLQEKRQALAQEKETVLEQAFVKDVEELNEIVKNGWVSLVKVCTFNKTHRIRNNVCK
jgi:hypothetical protein